MLTSRGSALARQEIEINKIPRYENVGVIASFDTIIKIPEQGSIGSQLLQFFLQEFESSHLTKFNIIKSIDTLITYV
jgi:hypothetical protein